VLPPTVGKSKYNSVLPNLLLEPPLIVVLPKSLKFHGLVGSSPFNPEGWKPVVTVVSID
jgi:hypothetical protein